MKIVVGLSGGVDSSVTAALLKEQGHEVIGAFMKNWDDATGTIKGDCPWREDRRDAMKVAAKLGIPFVTIDFVEEYKKRVVDYLFAEYQVGRTPNPDILCNREVKFDAFLQEALKLGADKVATGHYAQVQKNPDQSYALLAGIDNHKDQSYFLCQLDQTQLAKALFPLGSYTKDEVRTLAHHYDLPTADKKDSQGICFIGKVDLPLFLQQKLKSISGDILEVPPMTSIIDPSKCKKIGTHIGAHFFTPGQRKGLNVGGTEFPLFVVGTDVQKKIVYVGQGSDHPALYHDELSIHNDDVHWIHPSNQMELGMSKSFKVRIRYRQPLQDAMLTQFEEFLHIKFALPQRAIAPGQFAAWYDGNELLGSGIISDFTGENPLHHG